MTRKTAFFLPVILGLLIGFFGAVPHGGRAQDFPYAVPQAPEFDTGGPVPSGEADTEGLPRRKRSRAHHEQTPPTSPSNYRAVRPYVPQEPAPSVQPPSPVPRGRLGASYKGPTSAPAPSAAAPVPPGSVQNRPDCSQYPMMIARSRSEPEMREIAKQYLTCLLMNGWNMEQARSHVIATIESTFRLAR